MLFVNMKINQSTLYEVRRDLFFVLNEEMELSIKFQHMQSTAPTLAGHNFAMARRGVSASNQINAPRIAATLTRRTRAPTFRIRTFSKCGVRHNNNSPKESCSPNNRMMISNKC